MRILDKVLPLELYYTDEQYDRVNGLDYSAVVAFRISDQNLHEFRGLLFEQLSQLLNVSRLPVLHGVNFLRDYSDEIKFEAFRKILGAVRQYEGKGFRVGYFDDSIPPEIGTKAQKANLALSAGLHLSMGSDYQERYMFISELDTEAIAAGLPLSDFAIDQLYGFGQQSLSISLENFMGHVLAPKYHFGCQIADVLGYLCLKADEPCTAFAERLASIREEFDELYVMDRVIYLNDNSRDHTRK